MSLPLHRAMMLLGLLVCVECASISIENGAISPDIGKAELLKTKELLRRQVPEVQPKPSVDQEETESQTEQQLAPGSLTEMKDQEGGSSRSRWGNIPAAQQERQMSDWEGWYEQHTGSLPASQSHVFSEAQDPWLPQPPKIHHVPYEQHQIGYWEFQHDANLKHGEWAANHWHPFEPKGGPPHLGPTGHWQLAAEPAERVSLKEEMRLRNADRRHPSVPKWDKTWPPSEEGYKYHGHWAWHDGNNYEHPDWERPEEIMTKGNAALGPGRWAWNWQHQKEIWKPMPREEYEKYLDHIERVSPDHSIYEMSSDPLCASCAGGCALASKCEFQAEGEMSLKEMCLMKEGVLCAESYPGVKPPEATHEDAPVLPAGPSETGLNNFMWVNGNPVYVSSGGHR